LGKLPPWSIGRGGTLLSTVLLPALAAAQGIDENPVIRTSTRLVQVNVVVHDKNGPVSDLAKSDFVLTDRGRPQAISVFAVESIKESRPRGQQPLPQNTFSNRQSERPNAATSVTIVMLDRLNTRFEDQARANQQFIKFLRSFNPADRIAIYTLGTSLRVLCDFTDAAQLQRILAKYRSAVSTDFAVAEPDAANTGNDDFDQALDTASKNLADATNIDRARKTLDAFVSIANHVADLPGRKNLVWVTGSLPFPMASAARSLNYANIAVYPVDARGLVGMPRQLAAVTPSGIKPGKTPVIPAFRPSGLDTLQDLADQTGGRAFYNTNDLSGAIHLALTDSAVTYTLGFYPESNTLDGKFHDLKVGVRRAGMDVRYRKGYFAFKETRASETQSLSNLLTAFGSPLESATIGLEAMLERVNRPQPNSLRIQWTVDIHNLQLAREGDLRTGAINVFFIQQDSTGHELDRVQDAFDIRLAKDNYEAYWKSGMTFHNDVPAKDGAATLRIVLADRSSAAVGSLIVSLSQVK
jgi:VWFA-related protein